MNIVPQAGGGLPPSVRMNFSGTQTELFRVLLRGSLLQIPTFGFYRFWLTTDVRRHLWAHTEIGGDSFEYTGRARELLIGFLIAMAVLVPIYILYFVLTLEAERLMAFASVPLFLVLYMLGYYALYRARRYRATRTVFRGVRFWMTGSGVAFLGRAIVWDIITVVTLGLGYAWRSAALEGYKMRHTRYGGLEGSFVGTGWTLFKRAGWIWAIFLFVAIMLAVFLVREDWISAAVLGVVLGIASIFILPIFMAIEYRWWLEGIRFGPVFATSDLSIGAVLKVYFKTILFSFLYSTVGGMMIAVAAGVVVGIVTLATGMSPEGGSEGAAPSMPMLVGGAVLGGVVYIAFLLGFDLIKRLVFDRGLWAAAVSSVTLSNLYVLDQVVAAGGETPSGIGEGLLDALDFGGGV
jgi:uncharacterized membrane protein YjgN (DUF898 family)